MTNREYLEAAEESLIEKGIATGKPFNNSLDSVINLACAMSLRDKGVVRLGQLVRILKGNHKGFANTIVMIDWNEASIRLKGNPRWFCIWGDPDYFEVL